LVTTSPAAEPEQIEEKLLGVGVAFWPLNPITTLHRR